MKKTTEAKRIELRKNHNDREERMTENPKHEETIITDPFGSWTGVSQDDIYAKPVQDVDDL